MLLQFSKSAKILLGIITLFAVGWFTIHFFSAIQYDVVTVQRGDVTETVYGLGKLKSDKRFEVIIGVLSTVSRKFVKEGDWVKKGAPLLAFESPTLFRAPFDGTITLAKVYEGETAVPNTPLLRMEDLNNRYIELSLEQQAMLRMKPGLNARVSFESLRGITFQGKVTSIYPREDDFLARIEVSDLDQSILPGMTADVAVELGTIHNALLVPIKSLQNGAVTVKRSGKWRKQKVEIGQVDGIHAEIKNGSLLEREEIRVPRDR